MAKPHNVPLPFALAAAAALLPVSAKDLPDPDGKPADMSKPVQVFIIMGQSNTLEMGKVGGADQDGTLEHATKTAGLYPYLVDDPGAKGSEVAGFFWWQGDRDSRSGALSGRYEKNLVQLIKQLRKDFNAPNAKFVTASLGQTEKGATDGGGKILDAMLAVDGESGNYPGFKGNVAAVYTHPLSKGGGSGGHYSGNAETYMNVGEAMDEAMVKLLEN